ncbi:hypothetical protein PV08_07920 [Exophiala spinifera]|uniref:Uncharacterized protein n=1 Tax=Exophiala spinifera TaxID=91928 RepID=A0A0D2BNM6_9EURO|nr:uncharacterized protein PV08_07920 [Exophiala spinifera]KIW12734.1 hypothetical protein PV08_07920 [Exophiala spinifera]
MGDHIGPNGSDDDLDYGDNIDLDYGDHLDLDDGDHLDLDHSDRNDLNNGGHDDLYHSDHNEPDYSKICDALTRTLAVISEVTSTFICNLDEESYENLNGIVKESIRKMENISQMLDDRARHNESDAESS